jgi:hypothetical protein
MRQPPSGAKPIFVAALICALLTLTGALAFGVRGLPTMPASFDVEGRSWPLDETRTVVGVVGHDLTHLLRL